MRYIIYFLLTITLIYSVKSEEIKIFYPSQNHQICRSEKLIIKWTGKPAEYIIEANSELSDGFKKIHGYEIKDNTLLWQINDADFLNVPFTVRVSNKLDLSDFDEISDITVFEETQIIEQTNSVQTCEGDDVYLKVDALGYGLLYQWFKDNEKIENSGSGVLTIKNAEYKNSGIYSCRITSSGKCGSLMSKPVSVYIATKTEFLSAPEEVFWEYGKSAVMTASIHANINETNNIKFDWYKDTIIYIKIGDKFFPDTIRLKLNEGKKYLGTQSQELVIKHLVWSDRSTYYCVAEGLCGSDSVSCMIGDESRFEVIKLSPDYYGCEGQDVTFKAKVITEVKGTFLYQWYKTGFKILKESDKFIGTKTPELTIKNATYDEDLNNYYVLVTWVEKKVSKRSEHFIYYPNMLPRITEQPRNTVIKDRSNKYYGETYIDVSVLNFEGCLYTWYRNGKQARKTCWQSNYWIGIDSCPPPPSERPTPPPPRPSVPEDVGWYRCKIENECGVTWTDSVYVAWDFYEFSSCAGKSLKVSVDDLGANYNYFWERKGTIIQESDKFINTSTCNLTINNLSTEDGGNYNIWVENKNTHLKIILCRAFVEVISPPFIQVDFPKEVSDTDEFIKQFYLSVLSNGPSLYYEYYIDNEKIASGTRYRKEYYINDYPFLFGGKNSNMQPGVYQMYFRNDCGETWSKKMKVTNSAYKPGGIVRLDDEDIPSSVYNYSESAKFNVFPNPAEDYLEISLDRRRLTPFVETIQVQIYNTLGIEVISTLSDAADTPQGGNFRIDISRLDAGVYFIRIGNKVEKFIKM